MLNHFYNKYRFLDNLKDKVVGVILQTTNYSQFTNFDKSNRSEANAHANDLLKKLSKDSHLALTPILVDSNFKVVDGQHRLWALSQLGLPVNYIIYSKISINDAPTLNSNQKRWSPMDYVEVFSNKGNMNYQCLLKELNKYKKTSPVNLIALTFSSNRSKLSGGFINRKIKDESYQFDLSKQLENEKFFDFITDLSSKVGGRHSIPSNVQEAIKFWYFNPNVNKKRLSSIIDKNLIDESPRNTNLCARLIGEKYNSHLRPQNKVNYYVDNKKNFDFIEED